VSNLARFTRAMFISLMTPGTHVMVGVGKPGIGKSEVARQVSHGMGIADENHVELFPAQMGPENFNGWSVPRTDGLHLEAEYDIRRLADAPKAHVVLDELSNTPRTTQAAMLRFMRSRRIGETYLDPDRIKMSAFMNPPQSSADAQDLSLPLANRCVWLAFPTPSREEHIQFMSMRSKPTPPAFPKWDDDAFWEAYNEVVPIYKSFMELDVHAELEEDCNDERVAARFPLAYATPRSWETAIRLAAACHMLGDQETMHDLLVGTLGQPQGLAFAAAYEKMDLVAFEKLRKDPSLWKHDPKRPDRTFAQMHHVAMAAVDGRYKGDEVVARFNDGFGILAHAFSNGAPEDVCIVACQHLGTNRPAKASLKPHINIIAKLQPLVKAAGYSS
jgi:MoxR-like ATPase